MTPRIQPPTTAALAAACFLLPCAATADVLADWAFDVPAAGTPLVEVPCRATGAVFSGPAVGLATADGGVLRVRRPSPGGGACFAPLPPLPADAPVWIVAELAGWHFDGRHGEYVAIGLADEIPDPSMSWSLEEINEVVIAEARIVRGRADQARASGRAWGNGASHTSTNLRVPVTEAATTALALWHDPVSHTYAVFFRNAEGAWRRCGRGACDPRGQRKLLRLNVFHPFNDSADERFDIRRITVTTVAPDGIALDSHAGLPWISAQSWAVADADSGEILAGHETGTRRKIASINKVMAAHIVCALIAGDPSLADEEVVFTATSASTPGSTTALPAGDRITMRDALFGLMLPSGNDMANTMAVHFGPRFAPPETPADNVAAQHTNFVAEMNRRARALGMLDTTYTTPAGFSSVERELTSTTADLMKLAAAAMADPLFREVVGTPQHTATITKADGSKREITWHNTNRLLGDGLATGIKTGTTGDAGACLLTAADLGDRRVFAVVLGSSSPNRRYIDTRNLLRAAAAGTLND